MISDISWSCIFQECQVIVAVILRHFLKRCHMRSLEHRKNQSTTNFKIFEHILKTNENQIKIVEVLNALPISLLQKSESYSGKTKYFFIPFLFKIRFMNSTKIKVKIFWNVEKIFINFPLVKQILLLNVLLSSYEIPNFLFHCGKKLCFSREASLFMLGTHKLF